MDSSDDAVLFRTIEQITTTVPAVFVVIRGCSPIGVRVVLVRSSCNGSSFVTLVVVVGVLVSTIHILMRLQQSGR